MIKRKTQREIQAMRLAGKICAEARKLAGSLVKAGATTQSIDEAVRDFIRSKGAIPAFLGYRGFPSSICASVNEAVIHGIRRRCQHRRRRCKRRLRRRLRRDVYRRQRRRRGETAD
jgi:methionyl aminopeptidase